MWRRRTGHGTAGSAGIMAWWADHERWLGYGHWGHVPRDGGTTGKTNVLGSRRGWEVYRGSTKLYMTCMVVVYE
jgi:hypothetical protein